MKIPIFQLPTFTSFFTTPLKIPLVVPLINITAQTVAESKESHTMSVINTNITSMIGQQNLSKSQNDLATSMERLSSGLRINSAKDDAAGQAIANRMSRHSVTLTTVSL